MAQVGSGTVSIEKLDYAYIRECSKAKELEKILRVLRSGREGYYPDLIEFCEKRLETVNPESKLLRTQSKVLGPSDLKLEELSELTENLRKWQDKMTAFKEVNGLGDASDLPPVRSSHILKGDKKKEVNHSDARKTKPEKIKGFDYQAWDKFDVDSECAKVDEEIENPPVPAKTKITIPESVPTDGLTEVEKEIKAVNEKNKGNEAFKAGDYEEALSYYSRSISLLPTAASYNNRALVYLRLERWKEARADCDKVLSTPDEEGNIKAKLRRASAYKSIGQLKKAKADLDFVLGKEPNNTRAKTILKEVEELDVRKQKAVESGESDDENPEPPKPGKTMVIQEVEGDSEEEEEDSPEELDPLAKESKIQEASSNQDQEKIEPGAHQTTDAPKNGDTPVPSVTPKFPTKTEAFKLKAGEFFKSGRYGEAGVQYTKAIESMREYFETNSKEEAHTVALAVLHNNRAACWLKEGNDRKCIDDCAEVLELKPWDAKALMRRAVAYEHMEKYALAYCDFKSAESIDWKNTFAQEGANRVAAHLRQIYGTKWRDRIPPVSLYSHRNNVGDHNSDIDSQPAQKTPAEKPVVIKTEPVTVPKTVKTPPKVRQTSAKHRERVAADAKAKSKTIKIEEFSSKPPKPKPSKQEKTQAKIKTAKNAKLSKQAKKLAKQKEELEKEAKRDEIKRNLFEKLKSEGNDFVKKSNYSSAIDCYTRCITLCPKETASYTNRALCFLKLNKNVSAANDCAEAIKIDPVNIKAYYRRSQARKAEGMYKDAERDLKKLLEIDPGNAAAMTELAALAKEAQGRFAGKTTQTSVSKDVPGAEKPIKKKIIIEEVDSESSDEGEYVLPTDDKKETLIAEMKSVTDKRAAEENEMLTAQEESNAGVPAHKSEEPALEVTGNQEEVTSHASETEEMAEKSTASQQNIVEQLSSAGPAEAKRDEKMTTEQSSTYPADASEPKKPLTPYEFGVLWNSVGDKSNLGAYKKILSDVPPSNLPSLISNKIDDHVISVVSKLAYDCVQDVGNAQRGFELMFYLSKSERFAMAAMFLSAEDVATVRSTFDALASKALQCTPQELRTLKKAYCL